MALTSLPLAPATPKTVCFASSGANAVVYTVPSGKTWVGTLTTASGTSYFSINGVNIYINAGTNNQSPIMPITLTSGSVIVFISNNTLYGLGVES